ncbi:hypothetical protein PSY31_23620, partial [Shigella flexneri]|nr:hypothetical protein [Shigella flexneri]
GVNSLSVSNFTLSNSSLLNFSAQVRLTARNPNKKITLNYDLMESQVFYESWFLSDTMVPPFSQGTKNDTSLSVNYAAAGTFL